MEYNQREHDMKKRGVIRVMFRVGDTGDLKKDWDSTMHKFFEWWNGDKWVELTQ